MFKAVAAFVNGGIRNFAPKVVKIFKCIFNKFNGIFVAERLSYEIKPRSAAHRTEENNIVVKFRAL